MTLPSLVSSEKNEGSAAHPKGIGIDLIEVPRVERLIDRYGKRFLERVFTEGERSYSFRRRYPAEHLAARFAAKEGVLKALGIGLTLGVSWREIEVVRLKTGQPTIQLTGRTKEIAGSRGIEIVLVSLSHQKSLAVAMVEAW